MMAWVYFIVSAVVIVVAGVRLTIYADYLSQRLNLGKAFIGVLLLAVVTSLPEAITSLVAVLSLDAADLALGNIVGSNTINPLLIVIMDLIYRRNAVTNDITPHNSHKFSAVMAVVLSVVLMGGIYSAEQGRSAGLGWLDLTSLVLAVVYILSMRKLYQIEIREDIEMELPHDSVPKMPKIIWQICLSAGFVVAAAMALARSADQIAIQTGLGETLVGSILLALVTSLPEIVVSVSAMKIGAMDMAIGNIFGSNMMNLFIVFICDLFYTCGFLLKEVSSTHLLTLCLGILLTITAILGICYRNKKSLLGLGLDSWALLLFYVGGTILIYL